ncbi:MAG: NADH-quinone oxidoreductase subunit N [Planctomycetaceae bacterium]|nr:NADH-quinone oxidoreductase subunit N [Planctomycetaceae bacterium]
MFQHLTSAISQVLPEVVLLATACVNLAVGPFLIGDDGTVPKGLKHRWGVWSLIALAIAAWLQCVPAPVVEATGLAPFLSDSLVSFVRLVTTVTGIVLVLINWNQTEDRDSAESHACLLFILAGANLIALANDLVVLFLALELVSIPTYLFLYVARRDRSGQEATLKYFLLSVFSSALVLYGFSFLYGVAGTTNLTALHQVLKNHELNTMPAMLLVSIVTIVAGLAFRITAVPFHFYAPDVFQGTANSAAALLSFVPKVAGFIALVRILGEPRITVASHWSLAEKSSDMLFLLAIATMFVGNLLALLQKNVRRLLAYSSIAHAGYMLVGLSVAVSAPQINDDATSAGSIGGLPALLFYLGVYGVTTLGVFALIASLSRPERPLETSEDLAGLSKTHPAGAFLAAVLLFGLTGLPPTAGFLGKLTLFLSAWNHGTDLGRRLAICLAINAAIAAWYYLRLIGVMYLQPSRDDTRRTTGVPAFVGVSLCAVASIALFFAPDWLWQALQRVGG